MKIHPVAQLEPNAWGLYDMSGNTWEWTHDWYQEDLGAAQVTDPIGPRDGDEHILRGGSYQGAVSSMRSAKRWYSGLNGSGVGFRCVRSIQ
jgi:formylglycine-generating enzyme required for sulfatase activity